MINFDDYVNEKKIIKHNKNWPYIPDHPYTILIKVQGLEKQIYY